MKNKLLLLLLSSLCLSLVACGGSSKSDNDEKSAVAESISEEEPEAVGEEAEEETPLDASDFIASWEYADYEMGFVIYDDGTYDFFSSDVDGLVYTAEWSALSDCIVLNNEYGGEETTLSFKADGNLMDRDGRTLVKCGTNGFSFAINTSNNEATDESATMTETNNDDVVEGAPIPLDEASGFSDYVSAWKCENDDSYVIRIYEDASCEITKAGTTTSACCKPGGDCLNIYLNDDGSFYTSLSMTANYELIDKDGNVYYVP